MIFMKRASGCERANGIIPTRCLPMRPVDPTRRLSVHFFPWIPTRVDSDLHGLRPPWIPTPVEYRPPWISKNVDSDPLSPKSRQGVRTHRVQNARGSERTGVRTHGVQNARGSKRTGFRMHEKNARKPPGSQCTGG